MYRRGRRWADMEEDEDLAEIHRGLLGPGGVPQPNGGGLVAVAPTLPQPTLELETAAWILTWMEPDIWPGRRRILLAWATRLLPYHWAPLWNAVVLGPSWTACAWLRSSRFVLVPMPLLIRASPTVW